MPFLPGMKHDFFKTNNVRVFATESGSNNKDLLEFMIVSWIIPLWREYHATGPLVILQDAPRAHGWTPELCEFSAKNEVFIAKFPHNSTTMTQCLDVHYFKAFRKIYRELCENLRAESGNEMPVFLGMLAAAFAFVPRGAPTVHTI